jgi:hypothetical protein
MRRMQCFHAFTLALFHACIPATLALLHPYTLFLVTERLDEGLPLRYLICVPKVGLDRQRQVRHP